MVGCGSAEEADAGAVRASRESMPTFIRERLSSMFFDADGDLAHEFYEEVVGGLRQLTEGLIPQVCLSQPRPRQLWRAQAVTWLAVRPLAPPGRS